MIIVQTSKKMRSLDMYGSKMGILRQHLVYPICDFLLVLRQALLAGADTYTAA